MALSINAKFRASIQYTLRRNIIFFSYFVNSVSQLLSHPNQIFLFTFHYHYLLSLYFPALHVFILIFATTFFTFNIYYLFMVSFDGLVCSFDSFLFFSLSFLTSSNSSSYCFSLFISIFHPVSFAANLAFWPSFPIARDS